MARRYLVEIDVVAQDGRAETLRLTEGDSYECEIAGQRHWYRPWLARAANFEARLTQLWGGRVETRAEVTIINRGGWVDAYDSWSWRAVRLYEGPRGRWVPYSAYTCILRATVTARDYVSRSEVSLTLAGPLAAWDRDLPRLTYRGDNDGPVGLEGGPDLAGQTKPLWFGPVRNVEAVCVNSSLNIWQVQDERQAPLLTGLTLREGGLVVPLDRDVTLAAIQDPGLTVSPTGYVRCLPAGLVRLGFAAAKPVTADLVQPGTIDAVASLAGLPWHSPSGGNLPAAWQAEQSAGATVDAMTPTLWWWLDPAADDGTAMVAQMLWPEAPLANWMPRLVADWSVGPHTPDITAAPRGGVDGWGGVPVWRVELRHSRNWRPMRDGDLYGAVPAADRAWLMQEWGGSAVWEQPEVRATWPDAREIVVDTPFQADWAGRGRLIANIHGTWRRRRVLTVPARYAPGRLVVGGWLPGGGIILSLSTTDGRSYEVEVLS